ncbi:hypothetical protein BpHYR1_003521 [Brachionus plicatilis]|uniref:Uncharacterized protein n=1 Tax=Brachionus plicatilis TaxID=10195 RepID=A0A3M7RV82_BRAPC|nr:hypothetical protein BpHYR1_003521 [Brachionus plicatilis]
MELKLAEQVVYSFICFLKIVYNPVLHIGNSKPLFGYMGPDPRYLAGDSLRILFIKYFVMNLKVSLKFGADDILMNRYPVRTPLIKKNESTEKNAFDTIVNENL